MTDPEDILPQRTDERAEAPAPTQADEAFMRRALQLAARSPYDTHSNPMVGAVVVCDGRIIGEGYHRQCGKAHAEVNAIAAVKDRSLLSRSTIYVTLEPCSHYGKTPPCAKLIVESGIPRVVIAAVDPFSKVAGRGIAMLREAGIDVTTGVLADEAVALNRRFFTAHTLGRPFVTLKWAQSDDGFMDARRSPEDAAFRFSTPLTTALTHRQRALHDAILTTAATYLADRPSLTVRQWDGPNPKRYIYDRSNRLNGLNVSDFVIVNGEYTIAELLRRLYSEGVTSLLIEAGPRFLQAVIDSELWDVARIETSPALLGADGAYKAPAIPSGIRLPNDFPGAEDAIIFNNIVQILNPLPTKSKAEV